MKPGPFVFNPELDLDLEAARREAFGLWHWRRRLYCLGLYPFRWIARRYMRAAFRQIFDRDE
jgi:hypothetical protein